MKFILCCTFLALLCFQYVVGQSSGNNAASGSSKEFSCVICDNYNDKNCGHGDDVGEKYRTVCADWKIKNKDGQMVPGMEKPANETWNICRKIVTLVDFDVNSNKATERIKRTCGYVESDYDEKCYYRAGLGGRMTVCSCKESNCNHGNLLSPVNAGLCLTITLFIFLVKSLNFS